MAFAIRVLASAILASAAASAVAQVAPPGPVLRPGDPRPPTLPEIPRKPAPPPELTAPPSQPDAAYEGPRILVRRIVLEGNTVLDAASIDRVAQEYSGREVSSDEIEALRSALTRLYIDNGYVNSGVIVPDQDIRAGVLVLRAVEGSLTAITVDGDDLHLRTGYLESRLRIAAGRVLNLGSLREAIEILQQDGLVARINAAVIPGERRGEAELLVRVEETVPYQAGVGISNSRNTSVGEIRTEFFANHANLTGWGDRLEARIGTTQGVDDRAFTYSLPVTPYDTRVSLQANRSTALVVDPSLRALELRSRTDTAALGVEHPLWRTAAASLKAAILLERRKSETSLLGVPFSFTPGIADGKASAKVARASLAWLRRSADEVLSARIQLSGGESNAAEPRPSAAAPQRRFSALLGQLQWARRFPAWGSQVIARAEFQHTGDVLLPMERYGLGGANTVRGFRENQLLRDRGQLVSVEYRHPLLGTEDPTLLQIAPFVDHGRGRTLDGTMNEPSSITGTGIGLLWAPSRQFGIQVYAARASREFPNMTKRLQDRGVHFAATWNAF